MAVTITRDDITLIVAIVGALTGISGLLLSLFNLWLAWRRDRISLKVTPTFLYQFPEAGGFVKEDSFLKTPNGGKIPKIWLVEVINKGARVKLKEVGFLMKGTADRAVIMQQWLPCHVQLPHVLEPHDSVTIFADAMTEENFPYVAKYKCAFARLTSGQSFTGKSSGLKLNAKKLR
jgi:hypothetical protein